MNPATIIVYQSIILVQVGHKFHFNLKAVNGDSHYDYEWNAYFYK